MTSERHDSTGLTVTLPVHIMMALLDKPKRDDPEGLRRAAREYAHREIKKLFPQAGSWEQK